MLSSEVDIYRIYNINLYPKLYPSFIHYTKNEFSLQRMRKTNIIIKMTDC